MQLEDLAMCIKITPTSGPLFTAQAPLFPVFLLGLLATIPHQVAVADNWFSDVTKAQIRNVSMAERKHEDSH
jgi:hypothetical protein